LVNKRTVKVGGGENFKNFLRLGEGGGNSKNFLRLSGDGYIFLGEIGGAGGSADRLTPLYICNLFWIFFNLLDIRIQ